MWIVWIVPEYPRLVIYNFIITKLIDKINICSLVVKVFNKRTKLKTPQVRFLKSNCGVFNYNLTELIFILDIVINFSQFIINRHNKID